MDIGIPIRRMVATLAFWAFEVANLRRRLRSDPYNCRHARILSVRGDESFLVSIKTRFPAIPDGRSSMTSSFVNPVVGSTLCGIQKV